MGRTPVLPKWQLCKQPSAFPGSIPALFTLAPHPVHGACGSLDEALTVRRGQWGCRAGCPRPGADPSWTRASRPRDAPGPASPSPHLQRLSHVPACHTSPPSPCLDTCPWPVPGQPVQLQASAKTSLPTTIYPRKGWQWNHNPAREATFFMD